MKKYTLIWMLWLLWAGVAAAKKGDIDLSGGKLAVRLEIQDLTQQVRSGATIFGDRRAGVKDSGYEMPEDVAQHLEQIFNHLGIKFEFVQWVRPDENEMAGLKNRQKNKLIKQSQKQFLAGLKTDGFTDLISIHFFSRQLDHQRWTSPYINGFGVYKTPGAHCLYHTLGFFHTDLAKPGKAKGHEIKHTVPEKQKPDQMCQHGKDARKFGIKWLKDSSRYSATEQAIIKKAIKDMVLEALLDTFHRHGIIETQRFANQLYIEMMRSDYIVVEEVSADQYTIETETFSQDGLVDHLNDLVAQGEKTKMLVGLNSKSKFTFGDIKTIFKPVVEGQDMQLFRLGPDYELYEL